MASDPDDTTPTSPPASDAPTPESAVASDGVRWQLVATPPQISMGERAAFRLTRQAHNEGQSQIDASTQTASFTINGASSSTLDDLFSHAERTPIWHAVPPGETVDDTLGVGEVIFERPGDYHVVMSIDGVRVGAMIRVTP